MQARYVLETASYVDDLATAEAFYRRVLGLELYAREEGRYVFFRCGSGMLLLFNPDQTLKATGPVPIHGAKGPGHVAFAVQPAEIQRWKDHLHESGVPIEAEIDWPRGGHSIYFRDPAGNSVELATPQVWGLPTE